MIKNKDYCPNCGQNISPHWESLTKGIVGSLIKFREAISKYKINKLHLQSQVNLTKNQYNNFQKLRYHGLVDKYMENGIHLAGYWKITKQGEQFILDNLRLPKKVLIDIKGKVIGIAPETINIDELMKDVLIPYFEKIDDYKYQTSGSGELFSLN